jgi:hypothetical protein
LPQALYGPPFFMLRGGIEKIILLPPPLTLPQEMTMCDLSLFLRGRVFYVDKGVCGFLKTRGEDPL